MSDYMQNKKSDMGVEAAVSDFTQRHFWNRLKAERVKDMARQVHGIDYVINLNGRTYNVDEKAKVYGCLNRILECPSFELSFRNRTGIVQDGWFSSRQTQTDLYAFIAVFSDAQSTWDITPDNIDKVNMLLVAKKDVECLILNDIMHDAKTLRDFTDLRLEAGEMSPDNRKKYAHDKYWLTYSYHLNEQPVNLVVRRNTLLGLKNTMEFEISRNGVAKKSK